MVVASPMPSMPSAQRTRMITSVCFCIVCIASLCGRMVGRSTMTVWMLSISEWLISASDFPCQCSGLRRRQHRGCRGTATLAGDGEDGHGQRGNCTRHSEGHEVELQRQVDAQQRTAQQRADDGA